MRQDGPPRPFQADADVGWESRHEFDPPNVASAVWMVRCLEDSRKSRCTKNKFGHQLLIDCLRMPLITDALKTESHMFEKLAWAERCLQRMQDAKARGDTVAVQDHFWSLLHASRLIWFYLGEFVSSRGDPRGTAARLMNDWKSRTLNTTEQEHWGLLADLRTEDVHTKPVTADKQDRTSIAMRGGKILVSPQGICMAKITKYVVIYDDTEYDAFHIAESGVKLLKRFVADFKSLV
jgi:hypothetical protein